jgi:hypothetical protein
MQSNLFSSTARRGFLATIIASFAASPNSHSGSDSDSRKRNVFAAPRGVLHNSDTNSTD